MKICYIANIRLPTEKAHGIQIMKTCEALTVEGHEVTLFLPKRRNDTGLGGYNDVFGFYDVKKKFPIILIPTLNVLWLGRIGFWIQTLLFSELAAWKMWKVCPDAVYSRDPIILINLILVFKNIIFEAHRGDAGIIASLLLKKARLVTISHGLLDFYKKFLDDSSRACVVPDAVHVEKFEVRESKNECRTRLGLPHDKKIALYAGHLYEWKGAQFLAEASAMFGDNELSVFVGGTDHDIVNFKNLNKGNSHMTVVGHRPHGDIPYYLKAADVLILPNSGKEAISRLYTSPMKLFEYMASGTPIVASSLPSLREILDDSCAVLVPSDDANALYGGIRKIFDDPTVGERLGVAAREKVKNMTWENRAKAIINFIQQ